MYRPCETAEAGVGMQFYLTDCDGTGGRLKAEPQDFIVREISNDHPRSENGRYAIADVTSTNWETNRLIRLMTREMRISRERVGFAGTKDKRAVTTQRMSFECDPSLLQNIRLNDLEISNIFRSDRPVKMGDLKGNGFEINVKDTSTDSETTRCILDAVTSTVDSVGGFPNYYGVQRFGTARPVTHLVGEQLVRGDIRKAVETYLFFPSDLEEDDVREARDALRRCNGDYSGMDVILPKIMGFEQTLLDHLRVNPDDYKGAIEQMPTNLQMMFTHAYQSYLFNLILSERMRRGMPLDQPVEGDRVIPVDVNGVPDHDSPTAVTSRNMKLVEKQVRKGRAYVAASVFGSDGAFSDGEMGEIERRIVSEADVEAEDFIVTGLPHCSAKGDWREIVCRVDDLRTEITDFDYRLMFSLTKGNYATCLMREFLKTDMNRY